MTTPETLPTENNPGGLAARLDGILTARLTKRRDAENLSDSLAAALEPLEAFSGLLARLHSHPDPDISEGAKRLQPEMSVLMQRGRDQQALLQKLKTRFTRPTLNLGVVGRARQGKSTLLKALSGLDDEAIPTGRDFTTGAASTLLNDPSMSEGDAVGTVHFHDETSFLRDVLSPYWKAGIGLERTPPPLNVEVFRSTSLPSKPSDDCPDPVTGETLLKELRKVQESIADFQNHLTGSVKDGIARRDIRSYVAQTDANEKPLTTWRAVHRAEIRCAFPKREAGKIALVDTPGLGQIVAGLEDYVRDTLGNSLDFVLFVRLPPETGPVVEKQDTQLYNLLARAIPELPLAEWSTLVINQTSGNASVLDIFERHVADSAMHFNAGSYRVNCTDSGKAGDFLLKVLDYIARNLPGLDDRFLNIARERLASFTNECEALLARARQSFPQGTVDVVDKKLLNTLFDSQWIELGVGLNKLLDDYYNNPSEVEERFQTALEAVKKKIEAGSGLSIEDAEIGVNTPQGAEGWFAEQKHDLRTRLTSYFRGLDSCLDDVFNEMRSQVLVVLFRQQQGGGLAPLLESESNLRTELAKLESLAMLCEERESPEFAEIFRIFSEARLSFRGFIQHRILDKLGALSDWDEDELKVYPYPGKDAKKCWQILEQAWKRAGYLTLTSVEDMGIEVSRARWAFTMEFVDGILRQGGENNSKNFWRDLYRSYRNSIWSEKFGELKRDELTRAEWSRHLKEATERVKNLTAVCHV